MIDAFGDEQGVSCVGLIATGSTQLKEARSLRLSRTISNLLVLPVISLLPKQ